MKRSIDLRLFQSVKDIEGEVIDITQSLEKLQNKIMNLGPINFAAPETLEAEKKRKETLSEQINELETSLSKLDEAIKKIDKESNKTFHECLNSVNKFLEEMFPKLFGGGFSKLNLLDDSEDSGLVLMARLPGKKIQNYRNFLEVRKHLPLLLWCFLYSQLTLHHFVCWMRLMLL